MLIEFTVANFGSIKDPQVLEMAPAHTIRQLPDNCFVTGLPNQPKRLLRSTILYGPNASGKTHLIKAAHFMRDLVLNSNRKKVEEPIKANPFQLHPQTRSEPGAFQMIFIVDGCRHQYGFKVDQQRVWSEWLYLFPHRSGPVRSFRRDYDPGSDTFTIETQALNEIEKELPDIPEDCLALTTFGQKKKNNISELNATYNWFQKHLRIINAEQELDPSNTYKLLETENGTDWVLHFLKAADLGVENINKIHFNDSLEILNQFKIILDNKDTVLLNERSKIKEIQLARTISATGETVSFKRHMESRGTDQMFSLAGLWKEILDQGQTCFIDEMENGLHPKLTRFLLELFHDPEYNPHGAQLIATTHDTTLLDQHIFRPDQIWLMNKNREYASQMYPLSNFKIPRQGLKTLQQGYLDGLYGAVPMVRKWRLPTIHQQEEMAGGPI